MSFGSYSLDGAYTIDLSNLTTRSSSAICHLVTRLAAITAAESYLSLHPRKALPFMSTKTRLAMIGVGGMARHHIRQILSRATPLRSPSFANRQRNNMLSRPPYLKPKA